MEPVFTNLARIGKYLIPKFLRPRLREEYSYMVRSFHNRKQKKQLNTFLKSGGSYIDWYAERFDSVSKTEETTTNQVDLAWMETGCEDLKAAVNLGLKKNNSLLEFGCGEFRAANHFIDYLDNHCFSANDASAMRIEQGKKTLADILGHDIFQKKNPTFYVNEDNNFDWLEGKKFDFIWSGAVLPHMPEEDIRTLFENIKKAMHENSQFLFTYSCADLSKFRKWENTTKQERKDGIREIAKQNNVMFLIRTLQSKKGENCIEVSVKDWFHTLDFYKNIVEPRGYDIEDVTHALPKEQGNSFPMWIRLAKVTLKK